MEHVINSKNNQIIMHTKSLQNKKFRNQFQQFFIEGILIVEESIKSNAQIEYVIVNSDDKSKNITEITNILKEKNVDIYYVNKKLFEIISDTKNPQGILAVINNNKKNLNDILDKAEFLILLENIQDPGNIGTIIRTADAAGISGIIVSEGCVDIFNPKVLRSTMGSIFHIPIIVQSDFEYLLEELKNNGFNIFAAHPYGEKLCYSVDMKNKTAIVIGNEANGLSDNILSKCTPIKIPMPGNAESLNASVAASLLIYERVRQNL